MKRIIRVLCLILCLFFLSIEDCYADLSEEQGEQVAAFAKNMILKSAERKDSTGFGLIAYSQWDRIDGMQGRLSYFSRDYKNINTINAYKWAFDCSSFASYVYNHTLGINTYMDDSIRPYTVSTYVTDANQSRTFTNILTYARVSSLDLSLLKKGDLLAIVGEHIMVYIGDGLIAHVSSTAIEKGTNLGSEVIALKEKYPKRRINVIRLRDGIISKDLVPNTKITWPDTNEVEDIGATDNIPTINIDFSDTPSTRNTIKITFNDDKGLLGYSIGTTNARPSSWQTINNLKTFSTTYNVSSNGEYYIYAIDSKNQTSYTKVTVSNIDNTKPVINDVSFTYNKNETFNMTISAIDLNNLEYSIDGVNYYNTNVFSELSKQKYTVYVKDLAGNIETKDIDLSESVLPVVSVTYPSEYAKKVTLTIKATATNGLKGYYVNDIYEVPNSSQYIIFNGTQEVTYDIFENKTYYVWVIDSLNLVSYKKIYIGNIDTENPVISRIVVTNTNGNKVDITIEAADLESGIAGYSIDGINYQESNVFTNISKDNLVVYVKDRCENVLIKPVKIVNGAVEENNNTNTIIIIGVGISLILIIGGMIFINIKGKRRYN